MMEDIEYPYFCPESNCRSTTPFVHGAYVFCRKSCPNYPDNLKQRRLNTNGNFDGREYTGDEWKPIRRKKDRGWKV